MYERNARLILRLGPAGPAFGCPNLFQPNLSNHRVGLLIQPQGIQTKKPRSKRGCFVWCLEAESNHRHEDFQSSALPTELSRHQAAELKPLGGIKSTAVQKIALEIRR